MPDDQGGSVMDCTVGITGTLRAQEHGHQPLVYENHGIDARYTGPHTIAPTLSARAGTGGNNLPLVEQRDAAHGSPSEKDGILYARQRVDVFHDNDVASTESARQYKDATDLVCQQADSRRLIRRLTPLECERLQGFPDGWTALSDASDSARYRAWATAWPSLCGVHHAGNHHSGLLLIIRMTEAGQLMVVDHTHSL